MNVDALIGICIHTEIVEKPRKFVPFVFFTSAENQLLILISTFNILFMIVPLSSES
jgi:hypothetical protein